jgi:hypothetical protein
MRICLLAALLLSMLPAAASAAVQELPAVSLEQLAELVGEWLPADLFPTTDSNTGDKYAVGIDVQQTEVNLQLGNQQTTAWIHLYVRDGIIGGVRVEQTGATEDADRHAAFYATAVDVLLVSTLAPVAPPERFPATTDWNFGKGRVHVVGGYERQGLVLFALHSDMEPSYWEYWTAWHAEIDALSEGFFPFMF